MTRAILSFLMIILAITLALGGLFAAGYAGLYEIAIEYVLIMWTVASIMKATLQRDAVEGNSLVRGWKWFSTFKSNKIQQILAGKTVLPVLQIILLGACVGWLLALVFIFFKDWHYVISREIKETFFDFTMSISIIIIVVIVLSDTYTSWEYDDVPRYDPRDPEGYDHLARWGEAQAHISRKFDAAFKFLLTSHIILFIGVLIFLSGWYWHSAYSAINFLEFIRVWQLA